MRAVASPNVRTSRKLRRTAIGSRVEYGTKLPGVTVVRDHRPALRIRNPHPSGDVQFWYATPAIRHPPSTIRVSLAEQIRDTLGPSFTVERELGGGGMSRVFVAYDQKLERRVVVKVLAPSSWPT
jgi:serine/threonine protein kinase